MKITATYSNPEEAAMLAKLSLEWAKVGIEFSIRSARSFKNGNGVK